MLRDLTLADLNRTFRSQGSHGLVRFPDGTLKDIVVLDQEGRLSRLPSA